LSASINLIAPSLSIAFSVLSENQLKASLLLKRIRLVSDVFDLSASYNGIASAVLILFPVLVENEMKQQVCYFQDQVK
jgi:hypothetical protein